MAVLQIGQVGEIDDGDDRGHGDEGVEANRARELADNTGGGCAREIGQRSPEIIVSPGLPDRLVCLERSAHRHQAGVEGVLHERHQAEPGDEGARITLAEQVLKRP